MEETLFTKIIASKIPAKIAYEDERYIVIHDISPQAPVHVLVIPKKAIPTLNDLTPGDAELVGGMFLVAQKVMNGDGSHAITARCSTAAPGRSSRCSTSTCTCWRAGRSPGRRGNGAQMCVTRSMRQARQ